MLHLAASAVPILLIIFFPSVLKMPPSPIPSCALKRDVPAEAMCAASALLPLVSHAQTLFIAGTDFCSYASFHPAESKTEGEAVAGKCSLKSDSQQRKKEQRPPPRSALKPPSLDPEPYVGHCATPKYLLEATIPQ